MKNTTIETITSAFNIDKFAVQNLRNDKNFLDLVSKNTSIKVFDDGRVQFTDDTGKVSTGVMALHTQKSMNINGKERHKKAFYVEGSYYGMGYLIGLMAADDVYDMAYNYLDNIIPDFTHKKLSHKLKEDLVKALRFICRNYPYPFKKDIPQQYNDEIQGLHQGLLLIKGDKQCEHLSKNLFALNTGIDLLLATLYNAWFFDFINKSVEIIGIKKIEKNPDQFKIPIMCNAFSIKGNTVNEKHYFGRDFMFSTGEFFQDVACMIIYNPDDPKYQDPKKYPTAVPTVSQTAPGFIGSITAMNLNGVAAGTDMNPTKMCNPFQPGFNSLGLVRHSVQNSKNMDDLINCIKNNPRGVSWFYPAADGSSGRACFIEAGMSKTGNNFPYFDYFDKDSPYLKALTDHSFNIDFINKHQKNAPVNGMIVRESDYVYPEIYLTFNKILIDTYNQKNNKHLPYINPAKDGYINSTTHNKNSNNYPGTDEENCPAAYYFAPQRNTNPDLLIVTNSNITPEMRLTAMNEWIEKIAGGTINDIQWRYDELNHELSSAMNEAESSKISINKMQVRQILDFRSPGSYDYTVKYPQNNWETMVIHGSLSLCELKSKTITSHYGYYGDPWVTITLPNYFN